MLTSRAGLAIWWTWPFAMLTVRDDEVCLQILGWRRKQEKNEIVRINLVRGALWNSLHFCTKNPGNHFTFWGFDNFAVRDALESRGYAVTISRETPDCIGAQPPAA